MAIQVTFRDTQAVTTDELIGLLPHSKFARETAQLKKDRDLFERGIDWLMSGDTGSSSIAIFQHMIGLQKQRSSYPHDPDDLGRCLRLLEKFPEWKSRIGEMAEKGPAWAGLVAKWDELSAMMADEVGIDWSKGQSAPETYKAIKLAIADGYRNDSRYECKFYPSGTLSSASLKSEHNATASTHGFITDLGNLVSTSR